MNRAGLGFVDRTKYVGAQESRLIPFVFSDTQSYMLEFAAGFIRVYVDGVRASSQASVNATITLVQDGIVGFSVLRTITLAAPPITPILVGDTITISGVIATGTLQVNGTWVVRGVPATNKLYLDGSGDPSGVYTSGGVIGGPIEIASPYLESDLANLQYAQSADVLTVTLKRLPQYELRRTSSSPLAFTFLPVTYNDGPFLTQNTDTQIQVYASATTGAVTLIATSGIFAASHVGGLFRLEQENIGDVKPWEPTKLIALAAVNPSSVPEIRRNDGKTYKCVAAATAVTNTATGSIPPTHEEGVEMDGDGNKITSFADVVGVSWLYLDSGFGIIRITAFTSSTQVTGTVVRNLPSAVVGGVTTAFGPFTFSGNGVTKVFGPLVGNTSTDPTKYVVTIGGVIQNPATYTVTAGGGNITFIAAPVTGTNNIVVSQVSANNRSSLWTFGAWSDNQGYPATVTYFQDRQFFAGTTGQPQGVWASKTGQYSNFGTSVPQQDDDALTFFLNARSINAISDLIALESLLAVTSSAVWRVTDGQDEVLTPSTVGFKPQNYIGGRSSVRSAIVGDSAVYAQSDGRRVRDLLFDFQFDKFTGNELSILAEHLFPYGSEIVRMDYAQFPFSLLHAVRDDGTLPTLSYLRDQDVLGWSPWDTNGVIEDVCSIPENSITSTYAIVRRIINNVSTRYIERFANREFATIDDAFFVDAGATYDGRNTTSVTMALTGGVLWDSTENLTLTASSSIGWATFAPEDVGNEVWLYASAIVDDEEVTQSVRARITARTNAITVTVNAVSNVPTSLQGVAVTAWTFAKVVMSGLTHLAGEAVVILADGKDVDPQTVASDGTVTLSHPGGVVHAGLAYECDAETLDFNVPGAPTVRAKTKTIPSVNVLLYQTRGLLVGPDENHLDEVAQRLDEAYQDPNEPTTDITITPIPTGINVSGRVFIRQSRPLPTTILAILPDIEFGE